MFTQEMLAQSRKADSGLKLEVNEKILDSCTGLMQAIRILVQKSRVLQAEIVAQGKVGRVKDSNRVILLLPSMLNFHISYFPAVL